MSIITPRSSRITVALAGAIALAGCGTSKPPRAAKAPIDAHDLITNPVYPVLRGTVGEYVMFADAEPLPVEGWGIVANLPGTGSGDMSPEIRAILTDQLYREGLGSYVKGTQNLNPEHILASNQISAVEVHGVIPPLARRGDTFDLTVKALPDTQTTSLAGGLLWTSNLKLIGLRTDIDSQTIAQGRGPIFISNAITQAAGAQPSAAPRALRSGTVIGGGVCTQSRLIRLQLLSPSFRIAGAIERAINTRFPARNATASVDSDSIISLNIPAEYDNAPAEFINVVKHMFLEQEVPGFTERKAAELVKALQDPRAPLPEISLALQALGRSIVPDYLEPQYTSANPVLRYWAARAGAALNDVGGMVVLEEFANSESSPFREQAVKSIVAISNASDIVGGDTIRATLSLMRLVNSKQTSDRIAGYTGLVQIGSRAIRTYNVSNKFFLDIVPSDGPALIYVTQSQKPRVALIGRNLHLPQGAFYVSPDNLLTINVLDPASAATPDDPNVVTASAISASPEEIAPATQPADAAKKSSVVLYWRSPLDERNVNLKSPPGLTDVLIHLAWAPDPTQPGFNPNTPYIGASYQRVVEMLASMCKDQLIEAQFVMQKAPAPVNLNDAISGRPEGSTQIEPPPSLAPPLAPAAQ